MTNASGTLTSQQRYLPFGQARTDIGSITQTDFGYTGQRQLDDGMGGLMDYRARFYSNVLGRFIQPDSLIPEPSNPQAFNRYSYVGNRPLNFNDPSGHCGEVTYNGSIPTWNPCENPYAKTNTNGIPTGLSDEDFATYGVTVDSKFTKQEKISIMQAINKVGNAFAKTRGSDESAADAFVAVYEYMTFKKESDAGACGGEPGNTDTDSGGCTDGEHQIRFWSMSGHLYNDQFKMTLNVVHELGHAFDWTHYDPVTLTKASDYMSAAFTRDLVLRPNPYDPGRWYWQQSDKIESNEVFGDMFIAWTYNTWNTSTNPQNVAAVNAAQGWMNGLVPKP